jgi:hypothetical protein
VAQWLLVEAADPDRSEFGAELRGLCGPAATELVHRLWRTLEDLPQGRAEHPLLDPLLAWDDGRSTTRAAVLVSHLLRPGSDPPVGWYCPLGEHGTLIVRLLLVLWGLGGCTLAPEPDALGLRISWGTTEGPVEGRLVAVQARDVMLPPVEPAAGPVRMAQVVLDDPRSPIREGRVRYRRVAATGRLELIALARVRLSSILRTIGGSGDPANALTRKLKQVFLFPSPHTGAERPSIRRRLRRAASQGAS